MVEYGIAPQTEPTVRDGTTYSPDHDSHAAMLTEPDYHANVPPSEGKAGSTLEAPSPVKEVKPPKDVKDEHQIDTLLQSSNAAPATVAAVDPFNSHHGTENAEGL